MRVLVTGGTGALGTQVVERLVAGDHRVRITSRRAQSRAPLGVEVAQVDLGAADGAMDRALEGIDVIAHCATNPLRRTREVDIVGTERLLGAAARVGIKNFLYISIVGIDRQPISGYPYYRVKLEVERLIEASDVAWTILRATQFHTFIHLMLRASDRLPFQAVPRDVRFQLIDTGEVADHIVAAVEAPAAGRLPDIGGPRVETAEALALAYLRHAGSRKPMLRIPIGFGFGKGFVAGQNLCPDKAVGRVTWEDYLSRSLSKPRP